MRVCLVEADLRRPRAVSYLGLDGSVGLTEVVAGDHELDDVLMSWNRGQLTVLPAGMTPPDPGHLLGSNATDTLLQKLRADFDLVIIDAPPLLPVSDAAILAAASDGLIMVVRHGHVTGDQVRHSLDAVNAVGATLLGTILNATPTGQHRYGTGPSYDYASSRPEGTAEAFAPSSSMRLGDRFERSRK